MKKSASGASVGASGGSGVGRRGSGSKGSGKGSGKGKGKAHAGVDGTNEWEGPRGWKVVHPKEEEKEGRVRETFFWVVSRSLVYLSRRVRFTRRGGWLILPSLFSSLSSSSSSHKLNDAYVGLKYFRSSSRFGSSSQNQPNPTQSPLPFVRSLIRSPARVPLLFWLVADASPPLNPMATPSHVHHRSQSWSSTLARSQHQHQHQRRAGVPGRSVERCCEEGGGGVEGEISEGAGGEGGETEVEGEGWCGWGGEGGGGRGEGS